MRINMKTKQKKGNNQKIKHNKKEDCIDYCGNEGGGNEQSEAQVMSIMNKQALLLVGEELITCHLPAVLVKDRNDLTVGDRVSILNQGNGQYKMLDILPRVHGLYRGDRRSRGQEILVAANGDCLLTVVTADYLLHQAGFPEAAHIAAKRAGMEAGLFVGKWDLAGEKVREQLKDKLRIYQNIFDFVYAGNAFEEQKELSGRLKGRTTVIVGDRACGKTTLAQNILDAIESPVKDKPNEAEDHHTVLKSRRRAVGGTSASIMYEGEEGTFLIDTPGFRDFALSEISQEERDLVFPEMAEPARRCYFASCTHVHEEGCEILDLLRARKILRERYDAWQKASRSDTMGTPPKMKADYRHNACLESFTCKVCGKLVVPDGAGSRHRNHCPECLSSVHVDIEPGDRASLCGGIMEPLSVWVRGGGEWALIHRCRLCGGLSSNRIAADDNPAMLMSIAVKPLAMPPFPLYKLEEA